MDGIVNEMNRSLFGRSVLQLQIAAPLPPMSVAAWPWFARFPARFAVADYYPREFGICIVNCIQFQFLLPLACYM